MKQKMKKLTVLTIIGLSIVGGGLAAACAAGTGTANTTTSNTATNRATTTNTATAGNVGPSNTMVAGKDEPKSADETPALVKATFPDAQSFTKQHRDLSKDQIADIEKDSGAKIPDTDHHSYLAFSTAGGARKQIGAATIVKAAGKDVVVVYDSKNGSPVIKEVRAEGVPAPFLAQFAGKGHDDKFQVGSDLKANGADNAAAKAIASAVQIDALTMQTLYGAAHSH